jgi:hypothetical protein
MLDMNVFWDPDTNKDKLPTTTKLRNDLTKETNKVIERFDKKFQRYFPKPDLDQLIMMVFHPVMVWKGFLHVICNNC